MLRARWFPELTDHRLDAVVGGNSLQQVVRNDNLSL